MNNYFIITTLTLFVLGAAGLISLLRSRFDSPGRRCIGFVLFTVIIVPSMLYTIDETPSGRSNSDEAEISDPTVQTDGNPIQQRNGNIEDARLQRRREAPTLERDKFPLAVTISAEERNGMLSVILWFILTGWYFFIYRPRRKERPARKAELQLFEVSRRIKTNVPLFEIVEMLDDRLSRIAASVVRGEGDFVVKGVNLTFGSINRSDTTTIIVSKKVDGYLCVAQVRFRPSFLFWVFLILGLPTAFGPLISVLIYFHQKSLVRQSFESLFSRIDDEFHEEIERKGKSEASVEDEIAVLEKLAKLKDQGVITEAEFLAKKEKLFGGY